VVLIVDLSRDQQVRGTLLIFPVSFSGFILTKTLMNGVHDSDMPFIAFLDDTASVPELTSNDGHRMRRRRRSLSVPGNAETKPYSGHSRWQSQTYDHPLRSEPDFYSTPSADDITRPRLSRILGALDTAWIDQVGESESVVVDTRPPTPQSEEVVVFVHEVCGLSTFAFHT
jgi:hypothetical protein